MQISFLKNLNFWNGNGKLRLFSGGGRSLSTFFIQSRISDESHPLYLYFSEPREGRDWKHTIYRKHLSNSENNAMSFVTRITWRYFFLSGSFSLHKQLGTRTRGLLKVAITGLDMWIACSQKTMLASSFEFSQSIITMYKKKDAALQFHALLNWVAHNFPGTLRIDLNRKRRVDVGVEIWLHATQ